MYWFFNDVFFTDSIKSSYWKYSNFSLGIAKGLGYFYPYLRDSTDCFEYSNTKANSWWIVTPILVNFHKQRMQKSQRDFSVGVFSPFLPHFFSRFIIPNQVRLFYIHEKEKKFFFLFTAKYKLLNKIKSWTGNIENGTW